MISSFPIGHLPCKENLLSPVLLFAARLFGKTETDEPLSDAALAQRAAYDDGSFTELYERYVDRVYRFFFCRLRHREDAEDLTSETFMKIARTLDRYEDTGAPFAAWIFRIARNALIDHIRKNKIKPEPFEDEVTDARLMTDFDMQSVDLALLRKTLWAAIRTLPERQQHLWALKLTSDLPHGEIAKILGTTENNVHVMVFRSLATLKKRLAHLRNRA